MPFQILFSSDIKTPKEEEQTRKLSSHRLSFLHIYNTAYEMELPASSLTSAPTGESSTGRLCSAEGGPDSLPSRAPATRKLGSKYSLLNLFGKPTTMTMGVNAPECPYHNHTPASSTSKPSPTTSPAPPQNPCPDNPIIKLGVAALFAYVATSPSPPTETSTPLTNRYCREGTVGTECCFCAACDSGFR
jgi:hypothetical protein